MRKLVIILIAVCAAVTFINTVRTFTPDTTAAGAVIQADGK